MNTMFKKMTSVTASALLAVCSLDAFPAAFFADAEENSKVTVSFDLSDPDIYFEEDDDGNLLKPDTVTGTLTMGVKMPKEVPCKKGCTFAGWTVDGFWGYEPTDIFRTTESEVTMKPVFIEADAKVHTVIYEVEMGGEIIDTSKDLKNQKVLTNALFTPSFMSYQDSEKKSTGWTDGEHKFLQGNKFFMPDHDVKLTPIWHRRLTLTYSAGDYDDVVGGRTAVFDVIESQVKDLADASRFARLGYAIDHWHCEYDDKDYAFLESYVMPDDNVIMTAVWKPKNYKVVFNHNFSGSKDIKVPGDTGTTIKVPEPTESKEGYTFAGWSYDDKVYQPGDDFLIEGKLPGLGIQLKAVWVQDGAETTTTSATTTTVSSVLTTTTSKANTTSTTKVSSTTTSLKPADSTTTTTQTAPSTAHKFKAVKSYPVKTDYVVGDVLSTNGLEVEFYYNSDKNNLKKTSMVNCMTITDSKGKTYTEKDFSELPAGKYTVSAKGTVSYLRSEVSSAFETMTDVDISYEISIHDKDYIKVEVVKNGQLVYSPTLISYCHNMSYTQSTGETISTGPIEIMDTALVNPLILPKGNKENYSVYLNMFRLVKNREMGEEEEIPASDIKETTDKDKNITVYTITLKGDSNSKNGWDFGDANLDNEVSLADAVLIMQFIANPDKYGVNGTNENHITDLGLKYADVTGGEDGVTAADALAIQQYKLKLIDHLPVEKTEE